MCDPCPLDADHVVMGAALLALWNDREADWDDDSRELMRVLTEDRAYRFYPSVYPSVARALEASGWA